MDTFLRLPWYVGLGVALVVVLLYLACACGVVGEGEDWNVVALQSQLEDSRQKQAELEVRLEATKRSQQAKDEIVRDLIEQRLTLVEAAARFRNVHRATTGEDLAELLLLPPGRPLKDPPRNYEECLCWNVISCTVAYAELSLRQPEEQVAALRAHLEGELLDHLNLHGNVKLPALSQD